MKSYVVYFWIVVSILSLLLNCCYIIDNCYYTFGIYRTSYSRIHLFYTTTIICSEKFVWRYFVGDYHTRKYMCINIIRLQTRRLVCPRDGRIVFGTPNGTVECSRYRIITSRSTAAAVSSERFSSSSRRRTFYNRETRYFS